MKLIFFLVFLLLIAGCSSKPYIINNTDISVPKSKEVYIVNHGWHTGFVVPAYTIQTRLPELSSRFTDALFLEFGWGDKGFYQAEEITSSLTLRAIFWPTESVVHVVALEENPDLYLHNSVVETLCLKPKQFALLLGFIESSFYKDHTGKILSLKNGIYGNSQFYKGEGYYYLFNTCNKWTAKGLKSAGLNIHPIFSLTASSIMTYLSENDLELVIGACDKIQEQDIPTTKSTTPIP